MAITTYAELKIAVANWLARDDLTARIPEFIELAEVRLNRELSDISGTVSRSTMTIDSEYEAIPTGMTEMVELAIDGGSDPDEVLQQVAEWQIDALYNGSTSAKPEVFAVVGEELRFAPVPDQSYTGNYTAYVKPTALSDANQSNWFMTDAPDLLLYGALAESAPFLGDDARIATWSSLYERGLANLRDKDRKLRFQRKRPRSRSEVRMVARFGSGYNVNSDSF